MLVKWKVTAKLVRLLIEGLIYNVDDCSVRQWKCTCIPKDSLNLGLHGSDPFNFVVGENLRTTEVSVLA
jgi:hypothetical protein